MSKRKAEVQLTDRNYHDFIDQENDDAVEVEDDNNDDGEEEDEEELDEEYDDDEEEGGEGEEEDDDNDEEEGEEGEDEEEGEGSEQQQQQQQPKKKTKKITAQTTTAAAATKFTFQQARPEEIQKRDIKTAVRSSQPSTNTNTATAAGFGSGFSAFSGFSFKPPSSTSSSATAAVAATATATDAAAKAASTTASSSGGEDFYKKIRGLNVSIMEHVTRTLKTNPFADLTPAFDRYRDFLKDIRSAGGEDKKSAADATKGAIPASSPSLSSSSASAAPASKGPSSFPLFAAPAGTTGSGSGGQPSTSLSFNFGGRKDGGDASSTATPPIFQFTAPQTSTAAATTTGSTAAAATASKPFFQFSLPKPAAQAAGDGDTESAEGGDGDGDGEEDAPQEPPTVLQDIGEEDEVTLFEVPRFKLCRWDKEGSNWKNVGVGVLRINKDKASGRRRLLARMDGAGGKVFLNVALVPDVKAERTASQKDASLLCAEYDTASKSSVLVKYALRFKDAKNAADFVSNVDKYKSNG